MSPVAFARDPVATTTRLGFFPPPRLRGKAARKPLDLIHTSFKDGRFERESTIYRAVSFPENTWAGQLHERGDRKSVV